MSPTFFGIIQPDHGPNHIKKGAELKPGDVVVTHHLFNGQPANFTVTVQSVDLVRQTVMFAEWGDDNYPWGDYGLVPYKYGTTFDGVDAGGLYHQQHWLERVTNN